MKTLSQLLNESFKLNEKTSDIRRFKLYEKNPPEWYKSGKAKDEYEFIREVRDKLTSYYNYNTDNLTEYNFRISIQDLLDEMKKKYLNEYIDEEKVPFNVQAGMIEDILKTQAKKLRMTATLEFANYLNSEINWRSSK